MGDRGEEAMMERWRGAPWEGSAASFPEGVSVGKRGRTLK